jgi:tetratricopeptide (TPR) repeat protein
MAGFDKNRGAIAACLLLALTTLLLYLPATRNGFVDFDDNEYIIDNTHVTSGLTWAGIVWAFRITGYASNWHPLTWLSHALDCQLYGLSPGGHHLTSVFLHVTDSVLVLLLFRQMTGSLWRSTFVAALFAWHPLHVESVAWVSERKDVLSTFFWLLTMMAYVRYVHESGKASERSSNPEPGPNNRPKPWRFYMLALVLFALGLMSKPMLVTLPCALLLLDFWPLKRTFARLAPEEQPALLSLPWSRLIVEKIPFFLLTFAASLITYLVQQHAGAVSSLENVSLARRAGNAVVAYLQYVLKVIWPSNLAALYPYPRHQSIILILLAVGFLLVFSGLALLATKRRPYLFTGWFWFLGTLVPTIGLIQVGVQSMADRYTYIPSIGFFALVVWGLRDFLSACTSTGRTLAAAAGIIALLSFLVCTSFQITTWHDSEKLYRHAIAVTRDNYTAYNGLGAALKAENRPDEALTCYNRSVEINPRYPEGQYNLGTTLLNRGMLDAAINHLKAALKGNPDFATARNNLGTALLSQGKLDEAATQFSKAIQSKPDYAQAYYNLGTVLVARSRPEEAVTQFARAIQLRPDYFNAYGNLGVALLRLGRYAEGITRFSQAVQLRPEDAPSRSNLGLALMEAGRPAEAVVQLSEALRLNSSDPTAHFNLATALSVRHQTKEAISHYRAAIGLKPDFALALNNLAWILATDPNSDLRDSGEAVQLAQKACDLTGYKEAVPILTLATADASAANFPDAVALVQKARELALAAGDKEAAAKADLLLKLFEVGQPFRELH